MQSRRRRYTRNPQIIMEVKTLLSGAQSVPELEMFVRASLYICCAELADQAPIMPWTVSPEARPSGGRGGVQVSGFGGFLLARRCYESRCVLDLLMDGSMAPMRVDYIDDSCAL